MSTNYGRGDRPEDEDRTTAPSGNGNPTEPIADSHPTEPIRGTNQTEAIRGANPTEPIRGTNPTEPIRAEGKSAPVGTEAKPRAAGGATAASPGSWDYTADNPINSAEAKRRPRVGTVVWGLIVIALAVVLLLAEVATLSLNMGQVIIGLLIGAGLALVIGGVISASNREKDDKRP